MAVLTSSGCAFLDLRADPTSYDYGTVRYGKLSFVDLAGSERVKDSKSEGTMLKETININMSLSVLGKVCQHCRSGTAALLGSGSYSTMSVSGKILYCVS
jgi:hypothetical protein